MSNEGSPRLTEKAARPGLALYGRSSEVRNEMLVSAAAAAQRGGKDRRKSPVEIFLSGLLADP